MNTINPIFQHQFRLVFELKNKEEKFFKLLADNDNVPSLSMLVNNFDCTYQPITFSEPNCDLIIEFIDCVEESYMQMLRNFIDKPQAFNIRIQRLESKTGESLPASEYVIEIVSLFSLYYSGSYKGNDPIITKVWLKGRQRAFNGAN